MEGKTTFLSNHLFSGIVVGGAGGLGSEVREAIECSNLLPDFAGFLDDVPGTDVIGPLCAESVPADCGFILAIGNSRLRRDFVCRRFAGFQRWATVCHKSSFVSPRALLGVGTYVAAFSYVGPDASIGVHAVVNIHAQVGHGAVFGDFVTLSPYAGTNGAVTLGDGVYFGTAATVAPGVQIGAWTNVAAGSRVTKSFPALYLLHGNPAKGREFYELPE
jgi:acetyltransferase EpsM